jgi:thioredoxin-related protein
MSVVLLKNKFMRKILLLVAVTLIPLAVSSQSAIKWHTIEEAFALAESKPKKMLIDVYTDWCSWCKVMDNNTYSNQVIIDYINNKYYAVKFNAEQKENVEIKGVTYKYVANGSRGYNELAAALLNGQLGYPSTVFLDESLKMIQPVQGYLKPDAFDEIIKFIGDDHYRTTTWEKFSSTYISPLEAQQP